MTKGEEFETELEVYRDQVSKPLWRSFRAYVPVVERGAPEELLAADGYT